MSSRITIRSHAPKQNQNNVILQNALFKHERAKSNKVDI